MTGSSAQSELEKLWPSLQNVSAAVAEHIADGYASAPTLMIALAIVIVVPLLAVMGWLINLLLRADPPTEPAMAAEDTEWPQRGWIVVDGSRRLLPPELLSIGREDDNDLRLDHSSVHRHHAVVQRTADARFIVNDLSGRGGNGIKVNGARVSQAALRDGDRIEIGAVALTFEAQPA